MSVENLIKRTAKNIAVYWASPQNDGFGNFTFSDPIEIYCIWERKNELFKSNNGEEKVSFSIVYPLQDIDINGYLYLGRLSEIPSANLDNPKAVDGAYAVQQFDKIPNLSKNEYVRKVYL